MQKGLSLLDSFFSLVEDKLLLSKSKEITMANIHTNTYTYVFILFLYLFPFSIVNNALEHRNGIL